MLATVSKLANDGDSGVLLYLEAFGFRTYYPYMLPEAEIIFLTPLSLCSLNSKQHSIHDWWSPKLDFTRCEP